MSGVMYFLFFQACGIALGVTLLQRESVGARLLLGSVFGSLMLQWFPIIFAFLLDFTVPAHILAAVLAAALVFLLVFLNRKNFSFPFFDFIKSLAKRKFLLVIIAVWVFFMALVLRGFLFEDGAIYSSQATYGDMSMHLSFITGIARQGDFPPDYSLLPGTRLSYPFLSDSISSSLYLFGTSLRISYFLPMAAASAQVFFGFYLFVKRLVKRPGTACFAWLLFFFNGGFGFSYFLTGKYSFSQLFNDFYVTPTNLVDENVRWVNVIVDMMLPQRATLFGWAVLFPALYLLCRAVYDKEKKYFLLCGICAGLLPMIHTHSFLAFGVIAGVWMFCSLAKGLKRENVLVLCGKIIAAAWLPAMCLVQLAVNSFDLQDSDSLMYIVLIAACLFMLCLVFFVIKSRRQLKEIMSTWGVLLLSAIVLALPQLCFWTFGQVASGGMLRGHFGWVTEDDNYLVFYLKNLGLAGVMGLLGLVFGKKESFSKYAPVIIIWFIAEFVEFQPNDYDNNKLLYPAYALLCACAAELCTEILRGIKSRGLKACISTGTAAVCMLSAVLTMGREWVSKYELYSESAVSFAEYVEENTEPEDVILTNTRHNNEAAALAGRNIVCGSSSYLYFHGLDYWENELAVEEMYESPLENAELFEKYNVSYILVSDYELADYEVNESEIAGLSELVYDDGTRRLYRLNSEE